MLLYNWPKIYTAASGDPKECFRIFKMLVDGEIPENKYDPIYIYSKVDFTGTSFLLHPDVLLFNAYKYTRRDISVYLALAALRPLAMYLADNRAITLDLLQSPVDPRNEMTDDRLLTVEDRKIHFLYEKSPSEKEMH